VPATIEATWVPWPKWSVVEPDSAKSAAATTLPRRSGWVVSTPVSSTATLTPLPVSPADQAAGAPIWVRLGSRSVARNRRSSHTWVTPASLPVVRPAAGAGRGQGGPSLAAAARGWRTAVARRLVSSRTGRSEAAPRAGGRRAVRRCTINGEAGGAGVGVAHPLQGRHVEQLRVEQAADQVEDVAGDDVEVAVDRPDLEGRLGPRRLAATTCTVWRSPGRWRTSTLSPVSRVTATARPWDGPCRPGGRGGLGAGPGGRSGGGDQQGGHGEQDGEAGGLGAGRAWRPPPAVFVPSVRFAPNAP
jgi:hypothetical protein